MPGRYYTKNRRFPRLGNIVNSIKNNLNTVQGISASTNKTIDIAIASDAHDTTSSSSVTNGSKIFRIWVEFWYYGLSASETNDIIDLYIWKNPGNNLTAPNPGTVGTSNEKKFVFREWKGLAGLKSAGALPYSFRGWIKIPKVYQRMGTDDRFQIIVRSATTGNFCIETIYKWFR